MPSMKKAFTTEPHFYCKKRKQTLAIKTRRMYIRRSQGGSAKPDLLLRSYMVGRVLLRPELVDKPEHLHLSISRKLSNQWGTPHSLQERWRTVNTSKNTWVGQKRLAVILHGLQGRCLSNELCFLHGFLQKICYRLCNRQEVLLRMILPSDAVILDSTPPKKERKYLN